MKQGSSSFLRLFTSWRMAIYIAFCVPAILLEGAFALALFSSPNLSLLGPILRYAAYLPWVLVLLSVYSVIRFRTTLLLSLLIASYFLSAIVAGSAEIFGPGALGVEVIAALVVFTSFLVLISFNYARAARVLQGRKAMVTTGRSLNFQVIGFGIDVVLPVGIAVGLVILTEQMFHGVEAVVAGLPPPLNSVLTSQFVGTITAAFLTVLFTTVTLWVVRELVEPWVQYFAFTREDAVNQLNYDYAQMIGKKDRDPYKRPRFIRNSIAVSVALVAIAVLSFGTGALVANLGPAFGVGHPTVEHAFYSSVQGAYRQVQGAIDAVTKLLWG